MSNLSPSLFVVAGMTVLIVWIALTVRVVQEHERAVVFRLGRVLSRPKGPGLISVLPFGIDHIRKVSVQTVTMDVPPQEVITKNNIRMQVNTVVYCRVVDPVRAVMEVQDYLYATSEAAQTTLRAVLGRYDLDTLVRESEAINRELHQVIAMYTADWGVAVTGVQIKDLVLPGGDHIDYAALHAQAKGEADAQAKQPRKPRIFVCYRREDSRWAAGRLFDHLRSEYGDDQIFRDVDTATPGVRYDTRIESALDQCDVLIAVIGDTWLSAMDAKGRRRLDMPNDLVRLEIAAALERKIPIIPVLVQSAPMPTKEDLPDSISTLTYYDAFRLEEDRFNDDVPRPIRNINYLTSPKPR